MLQSIAAPWPRVVAILLAPGYLLMIAIGVAGIAYGLRSLRPQVRDIEDFFRARERKPSRWADLVASGSVIFALMALLVGLMFFMFGLALVVLGDPGR